MRCLLFLSFSLFFYTVIAQNKGAATKVTYESNRDTEYLITVRVSELVFNQGQSKYTKGDFYTNKLPENATVKKESQGKESFNEMYYVNLATKKLHTKSVAAKKIVVVEEELSHIPWEIQEHETDTIMGLACTKAIGLFRGREYTAWFAPEIPVPFCPWKLQGLPGLIIEAKGDRDEIEFAATKIESLSQDDPEAAIKVPLEKYNSLSLKEFVLQKRKDHKELMKRHLSSFPKGTQVSGVKVVKNSGLELKYEWEEK